MSTHYCAFLTVRILVPREHFPHLHLPHFGADSEIFDSINVFDTSDFHVMNSVGDVIYFVNYITLSMDGLVPQMHFPNLSFRRRKYREICSFSE